MRRIATFLAARGARTLTIVLTPLLLCGLALVAVPPSAKAEVAAAAAVPCQDFTGTYTMSATFTGTLSSQQWPGSTVIYGTAPCTISITRPSGNIDLVGTLGDDWEVSVPANSLMASASITTVHTPNCTAFLAFGSVVANRPSCSSAINAASPSTAQLSFRATADPALTVTKEGTGSGAVTSVPAGIACGATCEAQFNLGTAVTLTQTAAAGSHFVGWGGACAGGGATCTVSMSQSRSVTANFAIDDVSTLSITKGGAGAGTVTSNPAGINCGAGCQADFAPGTLVVLTATPGAGSTFAGWAGSGCTGTGVCTVEMTGNKSVVANFSPTPVPTTLTVATSGTGSGTVTSSPAGIDCGSTCAADFDSGTSVTLTAAPAAGSTFSGWSGGGCAGTGTCVVELATATTVTAGFTANAATYRPDGLVGVGKQRLVGDRIYNLTGARQTKSALIKRKKSASFRWVVQNDGTGSDRLRLSQSAKGKGGFTITFKVGAKNITRSVMNGQYVAALAPGRTRTITVRVTATKKAKVRSSRVWLLRATTSSGTAADVVGLKATAKE